MFVMNVFREELSFPIVEDSVTPDDFKAERMKSSDVAFGLGLDDFENSGGSLSLL